MKNMDIIQRFREGLRFVPLILILILFLFVHNEVDSLAESGASWLIYACVGYVLAFIVLSLIRWRFGSMGKESKALPWVSEALSLVSYLLITLMFLYIASAFVDQIEGGSFWGVFQWFLAISITVLVLYVFPFLLNLRVGRVLSIRVLIDKIEDGLITAKAHYHDNSELKFNGTLSETEIGCEYMIDVTNAVVHSHLVGGKTEHSIIITGNSNNIIKIKKIRKCDG